MASTLLSEADKRRKLHAETLEKLQKQEQERQEFLAQHADQIMAAQQAAFARQQAAKEAGMQRQFASQEAAKGRAASAANSAASRALTERSQNIGMAQFAESQAFRETQRKDQLREAAQARLDRDSSDRDAKVERAFNTPGTKKIQTGAGTYRTVANNDPDYKYEQHALTEIEKRKLKRRKDKDFIRYF